jgi:hypothetical protein
MEKTQNILIHDTPEVKEREQNSIYEWGDR